MGHLAAPLILLLLLCPVSPVSPCFTVPPDAPTKLNLTNSSHGCSELDWALFRRQIQLHLSHNGIKALSPSSRLEPGLEELDLSYNLLQELPAAFLSQAWGLRHLQLQHNRLQALPDGFFTNATALRSLQLEGNPLPAVPPTAFQPSLRQLTVPCRCDVVTSTLASCSCSTAQCSQRHCLCLTSHGDAFNVTEFHLQQCQGSVALAAGLAGAAGGVLLLLLLIAVALYRWRRGAIGATGTGWGKRELAGAQGQPRYISRAEDTGTGEAGTVEVGPMEAGSRGGAAAPEYENVFVSSCTASAAAQRWAPGWQQEHYSSQEPVDDDYYLESESMAGDQPIYANTKTPSEDNLYIIPDRQ